MTGPSVLFDAATALSIGARPAQEDAVLCDIPRGADPGLVVLADGLGGHAAGAVASRLAVSAAHRYLAARRTPDGGFRGAVPQLLREAAQVANRAILTHVSQHPDTAGMGATLIILALLEDRVFWLSIGDSPLYLLREGKPVQLNEVHSLARHLDLLVRAGELTADAAARHPDRHCLTSALGAEDLGPIDCPDAPLALRPDDMLLAASDGILTLTSDRLADLLTADPEQGSSDIAQALLAAVDGCDHPNQDNLSLAVIRARPAHASTALPRPQARRLHGARLRAAIAAPARALLRPRTLPPLQQRDA